MSNLIVKERDIVIPGDILAEGMDYLPGDNTYREGDKIFSKILGLTGVAGRVIRITPLSGPYVPKVGDKIIGKVTDMTMTSFRVDTGTAYSAMLNIRDATTRFVRSDEDMSRILNIGEYIVVKITKVTSQNLIDLSMKEPGLHKVIGGRIIKINSQKVPRVIGKQGSMINLIKNKTGCNITVGQNGFVWIKGTPENELLVTKAIKLIEEKSHQEGLTEKVDAFLGDIKAPEGSVVTEE
ncbi:RNA-binding protein [Candidatus Woesearchaeota archaeon CG_4_10_14_0_2_um_filter_33_13]|nr:MAG: RNA-binding protein [Candidatus Woesearchaeota archaeon CG_4_10_14_0_2_um_filter_33_13]